MAVCPNELAFDASTLFATKYRAEPVLLSPATPSMPAFPPGVRSLRWLVVVLYS